MSVTHTEYLERAGSCLIVVRQEDGSHTYEDICEDMVPVVFGGSSRKLSFEVDAGEIFEGLAPFFLENRSRLASILGWTAGDMLEFSSSQEQESLEDILHEAVLNEISNSPNDLGLLEELCILSGITHYRFSAHGCCQGDYIEGIAVATNKFHEEWYGGRNSAPAKETVVEVLKSRCETYAAAAFGYVYTVDLVEIPRDVLELESRAKVLQEAWENGRRLTDADQEFLDENADLLNEDGIFQHLSDSGTIYDQIIDSLTIVEDLPTFETHPDIREFRDQARQKQARAEEKEAAAWA